MKPPPAPIHQPMTNEVCNSPFTHSHMHPPAHRQKKYLFTIKPLPCCSDARSFGTVSTLIACFWTLRQRAFHPLCGGSNIIAKSSSGGVGLACKPGQNRSTGDPPPKGGGEPYWVRSGGTTRMALTRVAGLSREWRGERWGVNASSTVNFSLPNRHAKRLHS